MVALYCTDTLTETRQVENQNLYYEELRMVA